MAERYADLGKCGVETFLERGFFAGGDAFAIACLGWASVNEILGRRDVHTLVKSEDILAHCISLWTSTDEVSSHMESIVEEKEVLGFIEDVVVIKKSPVNPDRAADHASVQPPEVYVGTRTLLNAQRESLTIRTVRPYEFLDSSQDYDKSGIGRVQQGTIVFPSP